MDSYKKKSIDDIRNEIHNMSEMIMKQSFVDVFQSLKMLISSSFKANLITRAFCVKL